MGEKNSDIITKRYIKSILFQTVFVIVLILTIAACSFSLAKYISSKNSDNNASVANMGIETFELVGPENSEYEWEKFDDGMYDGMFGVSYKTVVDYTKVAPGADIPAPYIKLKINSEVSYRMYVKITVSKELPYYYININQEAEKEPVYFKEHSVLIIENMEDDKWSQLTNNLDEENRKYNIYTYEYKDIFRAGTPYDNGNGGDQRISILNGDVIWVSQYYGRKENVKEYENNTPDFTVEFEIYIKQVLE